MGRGRVGGVGLRERLGLVGLVALERRRVEWLRALRWRRRVEAVLEGSGLTFRQWLVIVALAEVRRKTGDAVSQNEVATYLELPRNAVSEVMLDLADAGWVDRDCSASGMRLRIYLTREAEALLCKLAQRLESASANDE